MIKVKRAYDTPGKQDGYRVLVDRIWPRGLKKEEAVIDRWLKEVAPSTELRRWFGHESKKWPEFCKRYAAELENKTDAIQFLLEQGRNGTLTLIYAARNTEHNNAVALKRFLESSLTGGSRE
ncbi:MAG: DUF488 domain-containing protein [Halieaceae bacterium]|nr:DUF488 domain-containing protein [Halieaceae bacterium]